jgi:uncharacterized protein YneF (UPF0154 family)
LAQLVIIFYGISIFIVGGYFVAAKIIRETTEIKEYLRLIKLSMTFGSLQQKSAEKESRKI